MSAKREKDPWSKVIAEIGLARDIRQTLDIGLSTLDYLLHRLDVVQQNLLVSLGIYFQVSLP